MFAKHALVHWRASFRRRALHVARLTCAASTSGSSSSAPARAEPLLVTDLSGQGQLVRLVLADLLATHRVPPAALIAITRAPDKVAEFQRRGVRVLPADFESADSVRQAFSAAGGTGTGTGTGRARRMLLISSDRGNRVEQHDGVLREAVAAGVRHVAFTSTTTPSKRCRLPPFPPDLFATEGRLLHYAHNTPDFTYTVLGFNFWNEVLLDNYRSAVRTGTLYTTWAGARAAHISREDCARAAAAALARNLNENAKYDVDGPQPLNRRDVADILRKKLKLAKPIRVSIVSAEEMRAKLMEGGVPEVYAQFMVTYEQYFREGSHASTRDGYFRLTGQQPESFAAFVERNSAQYAPHK